MLAPETALEFGQLLQKLLKSGAAVIVEGKKDKAALEKLGVGGGTVFVLNKQPLFAVAEGIAANYKRAAILTDLDSEGKKLYGRLNTQLQQLGVKVDNRLRNFLFKNTKLRQVEGLAVLHQP
ncbi:toprim domain-containing protein [Candidatus Woesearchaeota archaeon]|nr:toprim domain-containing protein [Candidatus Woesearchaeota archaeon]